jgi:imidazolonepropionase-like amidohydrolase
LPWNCAWSEFRPIYVRRFLESNHIDIPEVGSTTQATERVSKQIRLGANGIKIFANSIEQDGILTMALDLARAIVAEAHRAGKPVFAHVSNDQGIEVAIQSGVDILAHTTPADDVWTPAFAERLAAAHMALTPTLTLWEAEYKGSDPKTREGDGQGSSATEGFFGRRRANPVWH